MDAMRAWDIHDVTLPDGRRLRMRCWPGRGARGDRFVADRDERVAEERDATVTRDERA